MAGTNDFQVFGGQGGANVISQATYLALPAKATGFQSGLAASNQANKVWRQSTIMAAMIGQFIADQANVNAVDDGTTATLEANFILAIQAITRKKLTGPLDIYVNTSTGNDANNGLAPASAFKTLQAAVDAGYAGYDYNRNLLRINVADGTYTAGASMVGLPIGCSGVVITGNLTTPSNVQITVTNGNAFQCNQACLATIQGMQISASGTGTTFSAIGYGISSNQSWININRITLGSCGTTQMTAVNAGIIVANGNPFTLTGSAPVGMSVGNGGNIWFVNSTVTLSSPTYASAFLSASSCGVLQAQGNTFVGTATGSRYSVSQNAVVLTNGGGANYFPGNTAGSVTTGGQYI